MKTGIPIEAGTELSVNREEMASLRKDGEVLKSVLLTSQDEDLKSQNLSFFSTRMEFSGLKAKPLGDDLKQTMLNPGGSEVVKTKSELLLLSAWYSGNRK